MLKLLKKEEFDQHIDFAFSMALDLEKSVYPTFADGIKAKADFSNRSLAAYQTEHEEILLFEVNGKVEGWIHYYALPEDKYISFCAFNVAHFVEQAVEEFIKYISAKYSGCTLYFGLPTQNVKMIAHLERLNFEIQEECNVDVILFKNYEYLKEEIETVKITRENFAEFAALHKIHDEDMYWNNERILSEVEKWDIYLVHKNKVAAGAIYYYCYGTSMEIFGVDYLDNQYDESVFKALLTRALNEGKRSGMTDLTYFNEDKEHQVVSKLGFAHVSRYVLHAREI